MTIKDLLRWRIYKHLEKMTPRELERFSALVFSALCMQPRIWRHWRDYAECQPWVIG